MLCDQTFLAPAHAPGAPTGSEPEGGNAISQVLPKSGVKFTCFLFFLKLSLPPGKRKSLPFIIAGYLLINDSRMLSNFGDVKR